MQSTIVQTLFLFFFSFISFCQKADSVSVERVVNLNYTDKTINLIQQGITPLSFKLIEECDRSFDSAEIENYPQIVHAEQKHGGVSLLKVVVVADCCHNFLGEAELVGTNTLNLIYISYGDTCSCACLFTLQYEFDINKNVLIKHITINGEEEKRADPLKNNDRIATIRLIDGKEVMYNDIKIRVSKLSDFIKKQKPDLLMIKSERDLPVNYLIEILSISEKLNVKAVIDVDN